MSQLDLAAWQAGGNSRLYRGHRQFIRDHGQGEALVCLHGFPTASIDFQPLWTRICERFRGLTLDFLGYGLSDKPTDHAYSVVDGADQVVNWLHELGLRRVHLFAHDVGDSVAQELIARHGEGTLGIELASVVLLNGGLFPEQHRPQPVQRLLLSPVGPLVGRVMNRTLFGRRFSAVFGAHTKPDRAELDTLWSLVSRAGGAHITHQLIRYIPERRAHRDRWVGGLLHSEVPMRLINGTADPVSGGHVVDHWLSLDPQADCVRLPGVGHYPQLEDPDGVWQAAQAFWDHLGL